LRRILEGCGSCAERLQSPTLAVCRGAGPEQRKRLREAAMGTVKSRGSARQSLLPAETAKAGRTETSRKMIRWPPATVMAGQLSMSLHDETLQVSGRCAWQLAHRS